MVECLTRDGKPHRRHCVVSLSKNISPSLVLVQPRKTRPFITERLLMGRKESNQTNKQINYFLSKLNLISSLMGIYVLHTMSGKNNYLTVSNMQTSCFYHNYFKNYKLLKMITQKKMVNMIRTLSLHF